ncbi:MAG: type IIL restriction-modification enzyme MmeI [Candidatus Glassbacteria bacterium]
MTGDELIGTLDGKPKKYCIDLNSCNTVVEAMRYKPLFQHLENEVLPEIERKAKKEKFKERDGGWQNHLNHWWKYWRDRPELVERLNHISRYIACSRVTKRPIFEFIHNLVRPGDALQVFILQDDYSFGILQSTIHWEWFIERCSSLKSDPRYTSLTVYNTFPWPQCTNAKDIKSVAQASINLRKKRKEIMSKNKWCLRELYRSLDVPGSNPIKETTSELDHAVKIAYGMGSKVDTLEFLLKLNLTLADLEKKGERIIGPGLPPIIRNESEYITSDCIQPDP